MQLGGIGDYHNSDMHQVTKCMHEHGQLNKYGGGNMAMAPSAAARQIQQTNQEQQVQFTLNDWLRRLLQSGKQRLLGFWYDGESPASGDKSQKAGSNQMMMEQLSSGNGTHVTNSSNTEKDAAIYNSPYFAAMSTNQPQSTTATLVQKIKLKCSGITGQLAKHLPGKFSKFQKKGSFHSKKDGNQEDLRRRSKYREDKLEIDCILTDESYLLDSYDRKGEYTRLTTIK